VKVRARCVAMFLLGKSARGDRHLPSCATRIHDVGGSSAGPNRSAAASRSAGDRVPPSGIFGRLAAAYFGDEVCGADSVIHPELMGRSPRPLLLSRIAPTRWRTCATQALGGLCTSRGRATGPRSSPPQRTFKRSRTPAKTTESRKLADRRNLCDLLACPRDGGGSPWPRRIPATGPSSR